MSAGERLRVLIADDAEGVRTSVELALSSAGLDVHSVANGAEAIARLQAEPFDVLVTDVWMPETDGLTLIKRVEALCPGIRIFAMTGGGPRMTIETALSLAEVWGAEEVFVKPFDEDRLVAAILCENRVPHTGP